MCIRDDHQDIVIEAYADKCMFIYIYIYIYNIL